MKSILLTGGARSGKSRLAVELASKADGQVLFVATAEAADDEMKRRIKEHQKIWRLSWTALRIQWRTSSILQLEFICTACQKKNQSKIKGCPLWKKQNKEKKK